MTYIVNYATGVAAICKGSQQLTTCINEMHRNGEWLIECIIPVNLCEYFYIVYEFDTTIYFSQPIHRYELFKELDAMKQLGAVIRNIYEYRATR